MKNTKKAFTLIELIVVIAIIAILVLLASAKFGNYQREANVATIKSNIKLSESATELYFLRNNAWPIIEDTVYSATDLRELSNVIYDKRGSNVTLDETSDYYEIDYSLLYSEMTPPRNGPKYVLESNTGNVFYLSKLKEEGNKEIDSVYTITIINGTTSHIKAKEGTVVEITANTIQDKGFDEWTSNDGVTFKNKISEKTTFVMPNKNVTIKANHHISNYTYTAKANLVYEVTSITANDYNYVIEGWAFIKDNQHFVDSNDIQGHLALRSFDGNVRYPLTFSEKDLTDVMKGNATRRCGDTEYFKTSDECYYDIKYVKFVSEVPLSELVPSKYTVQLQLEAKDSGTQYGTDLMFPAESELTLTEGKRTYSITSHIDQRVFYINDEFTPARKTASLSSDVYQQTTSCPASPYGLKQYLEPYYHYFNMVQTTKVNDITWYQVNTTYQGCDDAGYHRVVDGGSDITWIPSTHIEYNGSPLMIHVVKANTPPVLTVTTPLTVNVGDTSVNLFDYVTAYDEDDGPMVPTIGVSNFNIEKVGNYMVEFVVVDSHGVRVSKAMVVRVVQP